MQRDFCNICLWDELILWSFEFTCIAPRLNHAVVMAKFAQNCLDKFREIVIMLDTELPGTGKYNVGSRAWG